MNLDQLKAFQKVAQVGNFTLASKKLFLTQPAVSQQIKALETSLQVKLFDRSAKRIRLTREGELILTRVHKLFKNLEEIKIVASQLNSLEKGKISIGATNVIGTYFLPKIIAAFSQKFSGIEISLKIGNSKKIHKHLKEGNIDFGFAGKLSGSFKQENTIIHTESFLFVTSPNNTTLKQKKTSLSDFLQNPFICREQGTQTRLLVKKFFLENTGKEFPNKLIELHNLEAAKKMVQEGYGITVLPEIIVRDEIASGLLANISTKKAVFDFNYYLFKQKFLSKASDAFLELVFKMNTFNQGKKRV